MWVRIFLENYTKLSLDAHTTFKSNWYLFPVLIWRLEMQPFVHKIDLKFPSRSTHGPTSPSDFYSKTTESCAYSLIPPSNHTEFCLFWSFWLEIYSHYLRKCIWKFEVSHIFEKSRWRTSSFLVLHNHIQWNLSHISFSDFSGEIMMYFRERDVITGRFPKKRGFPAISFRFRIGTCVPTP